MNFSILRYTSIEFRIDHRFSIFDGFLSNYSSDLNNIEGLELPHIDTGVVVIPLILEYSGVDKNSFNPLPQF